MLRPTTKIYWVLCIVALPLCAVAGVYPETIAVCGIILFLAALIAVIDARHVLISAANLTVQSPPLLKWFKDRKAELPVTVSGTDKPVQIAITLPTAIQAAALLPADRILPCLPTERGQFLLTECTLALRSRSGWFSAIVQRPLATEIRVYPDLQRDRGAALLLARRNLGSREQRQVGKGREFEKLREYLPGDSFDEIHWKASARRGKPVVKVFQIERTQQVYVILDASRLSARSGVLERYIDAALGLAIAAENQHDLFGLAVFTDRVDRFVRASSGRNHFATCREALYTVASKPVSPDFEELFTYLQLHLRRRALLLFLTALDDPLLAEQFNRDAKLISRRHLVVVNVPEQPAVRPLFTGTPPETLHGVYEHLAGHLQWTKVRELQRTLKAQGVALHVLDPAKLTLQLAQQYLTVKRRQAL